LADPGFAVDDPGAVFRAGRDERLVQGLALPVDPGAAAPGTGQVADRLWGAPVSVAPRDVRADLDAARADLEELAGRLVEAAERATELLRERER
jgi:hypothetical protein